MPKANNYEVKIRIKNHDLPKARVSDKMINLTFPKSAKSLEERERVNSSQGSLLIF